MSRSIWKPWTKIGRNTMITPELVNLGKIEITNGKELKTIKLTTELIRYKLGEFYPTKKPARYKCLKK